MKTREDPGLFAYRTRGRRHQHNEQKHLRKHSTGRVWAYSTRRETKASLEILRTDSQGEARPELCSTIFMQQVAVGALVGPPEHCYQGIRGSKSSWSTWSTNQGTDTMFRRAAIITLVSSCMDSNSGPPERTSCGKPPTASMRHELNFLIAGQAYTRASRLSLF